MREAEPDLGNEEQAAAALPRFSGGATSEEADDDARGWDQPEVRHAAAPAFTEAPRSSSQSSDPSASSVSQLRQASAKDRVASFAADARLGAQVLRVRAGIDAKIEAMREQKPVSNLLHRVGIKKTIGEACRPPQGAQGEVLELFNEEASLRQRIQNFHDMQSHLAELLPILEDYQRHRQGMADAEQRLGLALREAGVRTAGPFGQAIQDCGNAHRKAAERRLEALAVEEKGVVSVLRVHRNQAVADCKRSVRDYEASRQELRLLYEARMKAQRLKLQLEESGANIVDSMVTPHVETAAQQAEEASKRKIQATSETVAAKIAMIEVKHKLDYATAMALHMKTLAQEELDISTILGTIHGAVAVIQESTSDADLELS